MSPDLICAWPIHVDFPLFRQFIHNNRDHFSKIIVVFTNMNAGKDYRDWLRGELDKDHVLTINNDVVTASDDWRNLAVNRGLSYSDNEWVYFTEQDFLPYVDAFFWDIVEGTAPHYSVFGYFQEDRLHPCCIFATRKAINETSRNFGVVKDTSDHFSIFQQEITSPIGHLPHAIAEHYNGLSQNMYLLQIGEQPNYQPERFREYIQKCLRIELPIHPEIRLQLEKYVGIFR